MNILVAGDSITRGVIGERYLDLVKMDFPRHRITGFGLGGDTMLGITTRLLRYLDSPADVDCMVIQAGHNDILLPALSNRTSALRLLVQLLMKRGSVPVDTPHQFYSLYSKRIRELRYRFSGAMGIMTLSCVNEYRDSPTDRARRQYNAVIRQIAQEQELLLIDVGKRFDEVLDGGGRNYEISSLGEIFLNGIRCACCRSTESISSRKGLQLTIDGVHLNFRGAQLYRKAVAQALSNLAEAGEEH